ncbi:MAG: uracil-DNA glycosylase [Nonlabens sp.]|nr:uracil-DNA glycosylase [Nonlabens sp.]
MNLNLHQSWKTVLQQELEKDYFKNLQDFVAQEYATKTCFPPQDLIFAAMNRTPFEKVKVVILGQDPYHGAGQGNGLCFSVNDGVSMPPSLRNIFKELENDLGIPTPASGNLERWADQGVLLLNAVLTVQEGKANSHKKRGWEQFTDAAIKAINEQREQVVFMLWGNPAKTKAKLINTTKHLVLESKHPSPLSANKPGWFFQNQFSRVNGYLEKVGKEPVRW